MVQFVDHLAELLAAELAAAMKEARMRAAIYARCTAGLRPSVDLRENQREERIDDQIRVCRQFAARDGITVLEQLGGLRLISRQRRPRHARRAREGRLPVPRHHQRAHRGQMSQVLGGFAVGAGGQDRLGSRVMPGYADSVLAGDRRGIAKYENVFAFDHRSVTLRNY